MTFAGFDLYADPGDDALRDAVSEGFSWVASYLVAPSHSDASWRNYPVLKATGLNVLPIWVGAQVVGPGSHDVGAQQGTTEGQSCVTQLLAKQYPLGSGVAFDTENGPPLTDAQMQHLTAWQAAIVTGHYRPMVYGSYLNFDALASLFGPDNVWTFQLRDEPPPIPGVAVQYQQNVPLVLAGKTYQVDRNASTVADPAAPQSTVVILPVSVSTSTVPVVTSASSTAPGASPQPVPGATLQGPMVDFTPPPPVQLPPLITGIIGQALTRWSSGAAVGLAATGILAPNLVSPFESIVAGAGLWVASELAAYLLLYLRHQKAVQVVAVAKSS